MSKKHAAHSALSIQHTVVFRLIHPLGSDEEAAFLRDARAELTSIPGVEEFAIDRQISAKSSADFRFSMRFANQAAHDAYNVHPTHVAFVSSRWGTEVASFQEYDFSAL